MEFTSAGDPLYAQVVEARHSSLDQARPTLVLLHPTPLNHLFWAPVLPLLADYRLLVPDLRGHGRSFLGAALEAAAEPVLTIAQIARDALALLDTLAVECATFIGCSIGGYTLYELWRTAPERVAGLVFCSSKPQADTEPERAKRADWIAKHEAARLSGAQTPTLEFIDAMVTALLGAVTRRHRPDLVAEVRSMMEQVSPGAIQAIQRGLAARPDSRATAKTITVPTCVIAGEEDTSSTPQDLAALHSLLIEGGSTSEFHLLAGAGHYGAVEQPGLTASILSTFCRTVYG